MEVSPKIEPRVAVTIPAAVMSSNHSRLLAMIEPPGREEVAEVLAFAREHLRAIPRQIDGNYATHSIRVAETVAEMTTDPVLLRVALLHDLLAHADGETLLRQSPLTREERDLARKMFMLRHLRLDSNMEQLETALYAFIEQPKVLPLRIAHRLHDIRQLEEFPSDSAQHIATETLSIYCAIAQRFGFSAWRREMEDRCFRLLQPQEAAATQAMIDRVHGSEMGDLRRAKTFLSKHFRNAGIAAQIHCKTKCLYTTHSKMEREQIPFDGLHDRLQIRVIVGRSDWCYAALSVVHSIFSPMPGLLQDFIGSPKDNGYRSIDTFVYPCAGVTSRPLDISIRTAQMHDECEFGIGKGGRLAITRNTWLDLLHHLHVRGHEMQAPWQFAELLRGYFAGGIGLYDSKHNFYRLRPPVTALDFACHVYGSACAGLQSVSRNGVQCPLDTPLKNGDTVGARFSPATRVSKEWIDACRHDSSKDVIRRALVGLR
jgi:GTP diphosphokinase / guanosine-3',5'-bis(diphosphate) 3'-diphosphatase